MKFSLIIPCYNECKNLPLLVDRCSSIVRSPKWEVILVNNGSEDDSKIFFDELVQCTEGIRVVHLKENKGYGFGILAGLKCATGDVLCWTHADLQTDPKDVFFAEKIFDEHGDNIFVKGERYGRPFSDSVFTVGMSIFETVLLRKPMWDINAQPTMFSRSFFESWENPPFDFSLDLFAYYMAKKASLKVVRFPVKFGERVFGISHWNVDFKSKIKFIKRTVNYSLSLLKRI